jgi:hypothetical protein
MKAGIWSCDNNEFGVDDLSSTNRSRALGVNLYLWPSKTYFCVAILA